MKKKLSALAMVIVLVAGVITTLYTIGSAKEDAQNKFRSRLQKPDIIDNIFVGYNNWSYTLRSDGSYMYDKADADGNRVNAGGEFPRGSNVTIVFAGGFYVASLKGTDPVCSEIEYASEYQPGRITGSNTDFASLIPTAEAFNLPTLKTYVVSATGSDATDPTHDDYTNWPADAPYSGGAPGIIADAQTWTVVNDCDTTRGQNQAASPHPGLGLQVTIESFAINVANPDPDIAASLADVVFFKFTIANKTNVDYSNSYLGLWMDADIDASYAGNDIVGVDTTRGLGFTYNGDNADLGTDGFSRCTGFDFFQGPVVDTTTVSSVLVDKNRLNSTVLVYNTTINRYEVTALPGNQIWLGATSFNTYANGTDPSNNIERYNLLAGKFKDGSPKIGTGIDDYFAFRGNPLTQQGSADVAKVVDEADQRMLHGVGPFTLLANSAQEIWAGVIGGKGTDRLAAVAAMFSTDDYAQQVFNAGLIYPKPPNVPVINVTPLDGEVFITWDDNAEYSEDDFGEISHVDIAHGFSGDYVKNDFEGYKVYRSLSGLPGSWTTLAQYDLSDGITKTVNAFINKSGDLAVKVVSLGGETGLRHSYRDATVTNGTKYYYAVSSYDAQPYIGLTASPVQGPGGVGIPSPIGLPISLESPQSSNAVTVVPNKASVQFSVATLSSETPTHATGASDGVMQIRVVDPAKITGNDYKIIFDTIPAIAAKTVVGYAPAQMIFRVQRSPHGAGTFTTIKFDNKVDNPNTFYDGDADGLDTSAADANLDDRFFEANIQSLVATDSSGLNFPIVDGLQFRVFDAPPGFSSVMYEPGPQYTTAGLTTAHQRTWFQGGDGNSHNPAPGIWDNSEYPEFGIASPAGVDPGTGGTGTLYLNNAGVNFGGPFNSMATALLRNFDVVFSRDSTKWSYTYCTSGGSGNLVNYERVPWQVLEIDGADGDATPRLLCTSMRERNLVGTNAQAWCTYNGGFGTANAINDGTGPQTRGYFGIDSSTNDLTGKTGHYGALGGGEKLNGVGLFGGVAATASYAVGEFQARVITAKNGATDGLDFVTFAQTVFNGANSVNQGQQGTIYRAIPDEGTLHVSVNHILQLADTYTFTPTATVALAKTVVKSAMNVKVVPNPYYGRSNYQASIFDKKIKFIDLPDVCTIKIFTVSGDLVNIIEHNNMSNNDRQNVDPLANNSVAGAGFTSTETWDLRNQGGKFIASGIYIALVQSSFGKKTVKFAVIQEANQINGPDNR